MAIYHLSAQIISRGQGRSCVAAAAYRSGTCLVNEYDGELHDFTRKGGIVYNETLLPENAPSEYMQRATLWNAVEKTEKNKNAQLAREIEVALPIELNRQQQIKLLQKFVIENFVCKGMIADVAIHDKKDGNPHSHIMLTMRPLEEDGTWGAKSKKQYVLDENGEKMLLKSGEYKSVKVSTTEWDKVETLRSWRANWASLCNNELEKLNVLERIDHRSFKEQGRQEQPTIHLGTTANQLEKQGKPTQRGNMNRNIKKRNSLHRLREQAISGVHKIVEQLEYAVKTTREEDPRLAPKESVLENIRLIRETESMDKQWEKVKNLKDAAKTINFLVEHEALENNALDRKIEAVAQESRNITTQVKKIDAEIQMTNSTIKNLETYLRTKPIVEKQKNVLMKEKYKQEHMSDFILYGTAKKELEALKLSRFPQLKELRLKIADLKKSRKGLTERYQAKKKELQNYSNAKTNINVLLDKTQTRTPEK